MITGEMIKYAANNEANMQIIDAAVQAAHERGLIKVETIARVAKGSTAIGAGTALMLLHPCGWAIAAGTFIAACGVGVLAVESFHALCEKLIGLKECITNYWHKGEFVTNRVLKDNDVALIDDILSKNDTARLSYTR